MNESDKIHSEVTGKDYYPSKVCRILNLSQVAKYLSWNVELLDVYPSIDQKTGKQVLCFIFDRQNSKKAYDAWCKYQDKID